MVRKPKTWIDHFHNLVAAGLSPYQAERAVRMAAEYTPWSLDTHTDRLLLSTWWWFMLPGRFQDYEDALCRLEIQRGRFA